jgi:hypothetical protein
MRSTISQPPANPVVFSCRTGWHHARRRRTRGGSDPEHPSSELLQGQRFKPGLVRFSWGDAGGRNQAAVTELQDHHDEPHRRGGLVGIAVRSVRFENHCIIDAQQPALLADLQREHPLEHGKHLDGAPRVRLAIEGVRRLQSPIPQLHHVGRVGADTEKGAAAARTVTRGADSALTSEATPTWSAAARLHSVAMLGLPRADSTWITVPRLTPEAAASASMVIRRCWRNARTLRPTTPATSSGSCIRCSMPHR